MSAIAPNLIKGLKVALELRPFRGRDGLCADCQAQGRVQRLRDSSQEHRIPGTLVDLIRGQPCSLCEMVLHLLSSGDARLFLSGNSHKSDDELSQGRYQLVEEDFYFTWLGLSNSYLVLYKRPGQPNFRPVGLIYPRINLSTWIRRACSNSPQSIPTKPRAFGNIYFPGQDLKWSPRAALVDEYARRSCLRITRPHSPALGRRNRSYTADAGGPIRLG